MYITILLYPIIVLDHHFDKIITKGVILLKMVKYSMFVLWVSLFLYAIMEIIIALIVNTPFMEGLSHMDKGMIAIVASSFLIFLWLLIISKEDQNKQPILRLVK